MTSELPKTFDPATIEAKWYAHWESSGAFRPSRPDAQPYTIVMPPPNVTGSLHIGHALDNTLQDILIRHARLQGKDALWVVGTDHAGIATQMVVERQMAEKQDKRTNYSRDDFVAKVWEWKAESGGTITQQLRRLGASCDWANERFTMDEGFSKAVIKVFVELYNQGLLYRDKRLVNWDPGLKTAISDLEVETREVNGKFWHFKYPLEDGSGHISVATTRPETMLADMAVAVNAEDARYTHLIGKNVKLPITGRLIPIIADEHADPELGSGAVKITPGHDFNDFEVGKRAGIAPADMLNMLDADANLKQTEDELIPEDFFFVQMGEDSFKISDRFDTRKRVVDEMAKLGLLEKVEDRAIQTPFGDRSDVVIEPWLTDQWYVDAKTLAAPAIEAVRSGAIKVVPKTWEKTYFNWMENIQPWCVSRQLWWGHRIPAWYGPPLKDNSRQLKRTSFFDFASRDRALDGWIPFVAETEEEAKRLVALEYGVDISDVRVCEDKSEAQIATVPKLVEEQVREEYGLDPDTGHESSIGIYRDPDVLDTWFSSALWPFGTLGWPEENPPRNGEVAAGTADGGGGTVEQNDSAGIAHNARPLRPQEGAPPRSGEDLLDRHYPNDVLISGFDILFFWDARMIMQGLHFMRDENGNGIVPWKTLYLHGLVRAADGSKMSKSKGNTVDPLGLIDQYGADALRFTLTAMESQGRDIKLDEKRVEGYRNFATKLWNAARFAQANGIGASASVAAPSAELPVNRWIIGEVVATLTKLDAAIADLRFDAMADTIYHFAWGTFCDWYLELIKPILSPLPPAGGAGGGPDLRPKAQPVDGPTPSPSRQREGDVTETRAVAAWAFDQILVMLHPFMPFITEELWGAMGSREYGLIHAKWLSSEIPINNITLNNGTWPSSSDDRDVIEWVIGVTTAVRGARNEAGIAPGLPLKAYITDNAPNVGKYLGKVSDMLARVARINVIYPDAPPEGPAVRVAIPLGTLVLSLDGAIDLDAERARLTKAIEATTKERDALAGRLGNAAFVERAKPEAVEKARADMAEKSAEAERLSAALARLG